MSSGFISEGDLAQRRKARQENWDKNRTEDDPLEAPEDPESLPDHRSLYDRLQEQRQKKQDDWEEAHKLKNMVRGLEDDEVDFLELVDRTKLREEQRVKTEEHTALIEYRKKVAAMQQKASETELKPKDLESKKGAGTSHAGGDGTTKRTSQLSLLAGAIKRKSSSDDCEPSKKTKDDNNDSSPTKSTDAKGNTSGNLQCIAILPGIGVYTDSSDSDCTNSSDDDAPVIHHHPRDLTGRILKTQGGGGGQTECC